MRQGPKQPYVRNVLLKHAEEIATLRADVAELKGEDAKIVDGLRTLASEAAAALNDQAEAVTDSLQPQGAQLAWQHQQIRALSAVVQGGFIVKLLWLVTGRLPMPILVPPPAPTPAPERITRYQTQVKGVDAAPSPAVRQPPAGGSGWKGGIGGVE